MISPVSFRTTHIGDTICGWLSSVTGVKCFIFQAPETFFKNRPFCGKYNKHFTIVKWQSSWVKPVLWREAIWRSIVLFERIIWSQITWRMSKPPKSPLTDFSHLLFYLFTSLKILRCWFHQRSFLTMPFSRFTNATSLSPLICSLCFSLSPTCSIPWCALPVEVCPSLNLSLSHFHQLQS